MNSMKEIQFIRSTMKLYRWSALTAWITRGLRSAPTSSDHREKRFFADVDGDAAHWHIVRDIFVAAFHNYPLYKFVIPDENRRPEFLRRYLDAVIHASNQDRKSILVTFSKLITLSSKDTKSVVGGSLLLRPCFEGGSWKDMSDKDMAKAYDEFNLDEIDVDAVTRLKSYEQWESQYITDKLRTSGVPTWNAIFYGIEPKFIGNGNGSNGFVDGVSSLFQFQKELEESELPEHEDAIDDLTRIKESRKHISSLNVSHTPRNPHNSTFLILGITHCPRAAHFHRKNGMLHVASLPYFTRSGNSPFDVHILYYDPFESGKPQEIQKMFKEAPLR